ncbi:CAP Gly-rich domain-containing protein [Suillus clintonianus]|uniref:CAP Gly-rich domain-containing protein n=1 Tax=Suillus clintonianus TaxID=1904413 RepID=UPI001B85B877|nr:CAP Gly-rich domain-containing protein [Suillus clintonianus]KAG2141980.1 CAP Gly-rich domain-containing protein [Suillus clintonianus]
MSSIVKLFVVSPDTRSERRFDLHLTIEQLKTKLELITGIPVQNQKISLHNGDDDSQVVAQLDDDAKPLGYYSVRDFQTIKVADTNPSTSFTGQLTDVSQVEKFELSDDAYAQRTDSVLAYKQRHKVGRFAPPSIEPTPEPTVNIPIGSRCEVDSTEPGLHKRGTVRFVGQAEFAVGLWVGVEYDEPMGKNDGSLKGVQYFTCRPNYGVFVRPAKVTVGDFPVEEINFDDEEI